MCNHSENSFKKMLIVLSLVFLLFGAIDTQLSDHHQLGIVTAAEIDVLHKRKKHISREIEKGRQDVTAITSRESDIIKHLNQV